MARKPRLHFPGACYYVQIKGYPNSSIFDKSEDYRYFLSLLKEGLQRFDHQVLGFCLLSGSAHIAIRVSSIELSRIMQNVTFRYTRWFNARYNRTGQLFHGRYKAVLVDPGEYLVDLVCYLTRLPLEDGMSVDNYPWSSYSAYQGKNCPIPVECDEILEVLSPRAGHARRKLKRLVEKSDVAVPDFTRGTGESRIVGDENFVRQVFKTTRKKSRRSISLEKICDTVCKHYKADIEELQVEGKDRRAAEIRSVIAWLVMELPDVSLTDLSQKVNRDASTLSNSIRRLKVKSEKDETLNKTLQKLGKRFRLAGFN